MATNPRNIISSCLAPATAVLAQSPARCLTGRVVAEETGRPIAGRTVQAMERKASGAPAVLRAVTGANGRYTIDGAPAGNYILCAAADGRLSRPLPVGTAGGWPLSAAQPTASTMLLRKGAPAGPPSA